MTAERRGGAVRRSGGTTAGAAYEQLRRMIITTRLHPGERLDEGALMAKLGVGRTPLRDAIRTLAHEGLVEIVPRRATIVSPITVDDLEQIFEVRLAIEGVVAQGVIRHLKTNTVTRADELLRRASAQQESASDVEIDQAMHELLVEGAQNRFLTEFYRRLAASSLRLLYLTECGMESRAEQITTLQRVTDALTRKSAVELEAVLREHVMDFRRRVQRSVDRRASWSYLTGELELGADRDA